MSEWHVSASESEGEEGSERKAEVDVLELGGLKIPAARMVDLLQAVEKCSTAELECLSSVRRKRHGHRKKKQRRSHGAAVGESPSHGESGIKSIEEVSETTSDVRSTTSTNITAECRDTRRPDFSKFDPSLDPELDDDSGVPLKIVPLPSRKAPPPNHLKEKKLASLDKITADTIKRKQRWHQQMQQGLSEITSPPISSTSSTPSQNSTRIPLTSTSGGESGVVEMFNHERGIPSAQGFNEEAMMEVDGGGGGGGEPRPWQEEEEKEEGAGGQMEARELPSFRFEGDEDSEGEMNSEVDMKHSILSQINRVENLLDTEALT